MLLQRTVEAQVQPILHLQVTAHGTRDAHDIRGQAAVQ